MASDSSFCRRRFSYDDCLFFLFLRMRASLKPIKGVGGAQMQNLTRLAPERRAAESLHPAARRHRGCARPEKRLMKAETELTQAPAAKELFWLKLGQAFSKISHDLTQYSSHQRSLFTDRIEMSPRIRRSNDWLQGLLLHQPRVSIYANHIGSFRRR